LERVWKEGVVVCLMYYPVICLERLQKTTKKLARMAGDPANIQTGHLENMSTL